MKKSEKATVFSERLRKIRKASGMTQQEIADHLQMQRSTYAYYETGATEPSLKRLLSIAKEFTVSVDDLLCEVPSDPVMVLRQEAAQTQRTSDAAQRMRECDREERAFLSILRHLDADRRKKLYQACLDLLSKEERNDAFDKMFLGE